MAIEVAWGVPESLGDVGISGNKILPWTEADIEKL